MIESVIIVNYCWLVFLTCAVWRLYSRPISGVDPDDVDLIKDFMVSIRKMASAEKRKLKK